MDIVVFGLKVTILGFGTVFVALVGLMFLIGLQSKILAPKPTKAQLEPQKQEAVVMQDEPVNAEAEDEDEDELAAVIAAAIAAYGGQSVVIKTITRITGDAGSTWAASGRTEAMNMRKL